MHSCYRSSAAQKFLDIVTGRLMMRLVTPLTDYKFIIQTTNTSSGIQKFLRIVTDQLMMRLVTPLNRLRVHYSNPQHIITFQLKVVFEHPANVSVVLID